ncbi:putative GPI-anchored protein pfl2 [Lactuca sativa]|uniref:Uncharacterized protein n=1 Tax=Lactuca sativa TaxID=4236 RepID=A0A9R1XA88_LACSA|nr:putative GPI-anchored protein pfl2 [Lactuca sativa]KAJ0203149.1 hypothetical protein LSAT_V11C500284090 [Lactuca sativa]
MMMKRNSSKDSLIGIGGRNLHSNGIRNAPPVAGLLSHRRVMSFTSTTEDFNNSNSNNVDFLSRNRRSLSVASSDESDLQMRLGRLSVGSTKTAKNVLDDLLSSNEGGKHDYDWLLTPPGTPLLPCSSDGKESESQPTSTSISITPRRNSSVRSGSATKNSRLSASQSESIHPSNSKPARSSSTTTNRNPNILNTSSASVSSYIRPSTPTKRSSSTATSRPSTPSRTLPSTTTTTARSSSTTRPSQNSRPSTPTSPVIRQPSSRPSTPTCRSPTPSATSSPSSVRALSSNGRTVGPTSRPSSPSPRVRPPPQPIIPPDFPHETPPNLRTTLPERPLSAGRSRPGTAMATTSAASISRRQSSPIVTRGRHTVTEPPPSRGQLPVPESLTKRPIKMSNSEGVTGTGYGRNISKKSLDMAIKHMDIRNGGIRPSTLFPQSIRMQGGHGSSKNGTLYSSKIIKVDMYESSRYDSLLLKEELNDTTWLHNVEEKSDELGLLFDNGFETLPEPFSPL